MCQILQIQFFFSVTILYCFQKWDFQMELFRMSVVRQVPRVLRKDYASMRWWKDQKPLETQDKSVATVSFIYLLIRNYY